ncbi:2OG-Fe(II) oxygenase [Nocardia abscessus]|uniref:2OG-Fe(II) oxygenase n=1 Tax=Nocardia abscessus TaxID=120957 RepID=UPI001895162A|nr:2OG-Fe(II) oxygenase [Nocardia abscessus]MBF6336803.1 2OG-Fe(II) oxygenase [Nocardia abscessus]
MRIPQFELETRPVAAGRCFIEDTVVIADELVAIRVDDVLDPDYAASLADHLTCGIHYERDEIGDTKRVSRARRLGDMPDSPIATAAAPDMTALDALDMFVSPWWLDQLSRWLGQPLEVLRPTTPYRMDVGDYVDPHDDCPAPEYRLSVVCNFTADWTSGDGGETVVGLVEDVVEYDDSDWFFSLKKWTLRPETRQLAPRFNSALLLPLAPTRAHAVRPVQRGSRISITTLYGGIER